MQYKLVNQVRMRCPTPASAGQEAHTPGPPPGQDRGGLHRRPEHAVGGAVRGTAASGAAAADARHGRLVRPQAAVLEARPRCQSGDGLRPPRGGPQPGQPPAGLSVRSSLEVWPAPGPVLEEGADAPPPSSDMDSGCACGCPWSTARATAPSPGRPTPGVVKQDKSSGGSVDTTKTRSGPQRVRMSGGERPIGAAKGTQSDTEALCQPPPPPLRDSGSVYPSRFRPSPGAPQPFNGRPDRGPNASPIARVPASAAAPEAPCCLSLLQTQACSLRR